MATTDEASDAPTEPPLPIIDLTPLREDSPKHEDIVRLSQSLSHAFETTGFAYLANAPLSLDHATVFDIAQKFFALPASTKLSVAKKSFCPQNENTYHGYFPAQAGAAPDNLKEGFEIGPPEPVPQVVDLRAKINLTEPNVWPSAAEFASRAQAEQLHRELQSLSQRLLSLLAMALGKPAEYFDYMRPDSISTLRLLHYPPPSESDGNPAAPRQEFCCTPHTDSGILTLLHQDETGGLEVLSSTGEADGEEEWIPAPYIPDTLVVNIGDLMSKISGGRFKATMHRVRSSNNGTSDTTTTDKDSATRASTGPRSRYSVPFFFEPGIACVVRSAVPDGGMGVLYGEHVLEKMRGWVEFQDLSFAGQMEILQEVKGVDDQDVVVWETEVPEEDDVTL